MPLKSPATAARTNNERKTFCTDQPEEEHEPHLAPVALYSNVWFLVVDMGYHDAKQRQAQQKD